MGAPPLVRLWSQRQRHATQQDLADDASAVDERVGVLHRLRASRLDDTYERELRRLCKVDLLIVDDLALRAMDERETADLCEIVGARHRTASMIVTSNRDPSEWLQVLADPLHAQALVDRFTNNAYDLVVEGESYRRRQKPRGSNNASSRFEAMDGVILRIDLL